MCIEITNLRRESFFLDNITFTLGFDKPRINSLERFYYLSSGGIEVSTSVLITGVEINGAEIYFQLQTPIRLNYGQSIVLNLTGDFGYCLSGESIYISLENNCLNRWGSSEIIIQGIPLKFVINP